VPVVTGFFGPVPGSLLRQVGRGYTDLLAALLAVGLGAEELQIWKEVDGIFTADPRKVPTARLIPSISPDEAAELTYYGSEVVHPFTMEQVSPTSAPKKHTSQIRRSSERKSQFALRMSKTHLEMGPSFILTLTAATHLIRVIPSPQ
jgi:aspartate kinase